MILWLGGVTPNMRKCVKGLQHWEGENYRCIQTMGAKSVGENHVTLALFFFLTYLCRSNVPSWGFHRGSVCNESLYHLIKQQLSIYQKFVSKSQVFSMLGGPVDLAE